MLLFVSRPICRLIGLRSDPVFCRVHGAINLCKLVFLRFEFRISTVQWVRTDRAAD